MGFWQSVLCAALGSLALAGCADRATIAALCPPGCTPLTHDSVCDCSGTGVDPGACPGGGCAAGSAAVGCSGPGCVDAGASAAQCEPGAFALSRRRSDLLVVADDDTTLGFWWPALAQGFLDFVQEPSSAGMAIGLSRFGAACESAAYEQPLVAIEPLPGNAAALQQAFPLAGVAVTNSTIPALTGALAYTRRWASDHPGSQPALLLITDASPGACDGAAATSGYPAEAARIVGEAYSGNPSIKTYVLGGGGLQLIDEIASAGGTKAYPIAPLDGSAEVLAALHEIRADARGCELTWPDDRTLAPDSRVVARMPDGLSLRFDIVRSMASCDRDVLYVADEAARKLVACPRVCSMIASSDQLSLSSACR